MIQETLAEIRGNVQITKNTIENQAKDLMECKGNTEKCLESHTLLGEISAKCQEGFALTQKINGNTINTRGEVGQIKDQVNTIKTKVVALSMPPLEGEESDEDEVRGTPKPMTYASAAQGHPAQGQPSTNISDINGSETNTPKSESEVRSEEESFTPVSNRKDRKPEKNTVKVLIMHDST